MRLPYFCFLFLFGLRISGWHGQGGSKPAVMTRRYIGHGFGQQRAWQGLGRTFGPGIWQGKGRWSAQYMWEEAFVGFTRNHHSVVKNKVYLCCCDYTIHPHTRAHTNEYYYYYPPCLQSAPFPGRDAMTSNLMPRCRNIQLRIAAQSTTVCGDQAEKVQKERATCIVAG